jgi:hypothetical protein
MTLGKSFGLLACIIGGTAIFTGIIYEGRQSNANYEHQQSVMSCKAAQYDMYVYMSKLGLHRWEASCAAAVFADANQKPFTPGGGNLSGKVEKQCFIKLKDCGS